MSDGSRSFSSACVHEEGDGDEEKETNVDDITARRKSKSVPRRYESSNDLEKGLQVRIGNLFYSSS